MRLFFTLPALLVPRALAWNHFDEPEALKDALEENDWTLVAFVHPTDENFIPLEAEWDALSSKHPDDPRITSIDCSASPKLCTSLSISSFPTIRLYHCGGHFDRYRGPRRASSMNSFLQRMLRPPLSYVSAANTTAFLTADDVVFIGHLAPPAGATLRDLFSRAAARYRDRYSFALSSDRAPPAPIPHGQQGQGQEQQLQAKITCYNIPSQLQRSTPDVSSAAALDSFIRLCATPLVPELTRRNEMAYYQSGKSIVHYFASSEAERAAYAAEVLPLAQKYGEYLHFTTTDVNEYSDVPGLMGLRPGAAPALSVQNPSNGDVFPYTGGGKITAGAVEAFLVDIIQGRVKPWRKGKQAEREHEEL